MIFVNIDLTSQNIWSAKEHIVLLELLFLFLCGYENKKNAIPFVL